MNSRKYRLLLSKAHLAKLRKNQLVSLAPSKTTMKRNDGPSQRGMLSVLVLIISFFSLGIAMLGGAWVAGDILVNGLAYIVGWVVSLFGSRILGNLVLPTFIKICSYITLAGV